MRRSALLRAPAFWLALGLGVLLILALRYATTAVNYFVQPDELTYVRGAIFIGEELRPLKQGDFWFNSYAQLWPMIMAPLYAALPSLDAFDAAHVVQPIAFVSAGIPAYLLVRRLTDSGVAAVLTGLLTATVPWIALTISLMSEPVAYAAFGWALLLVVIGLTKGGARGDLIVLAGVVLAFVSRTQLAILGPVVVLAAILHEAGWSWRADRASARDAARAIVTRHPVLTGVVVVGILGIATGLIGTSVFGSYFVAVERQLLPDGTFDNARDLTAIATVAVGVITPALAAAWVLLTLWSPASRAQHAFASFAAVFCVVLPISSGAFVLNVGANINDRYVMYLAPVVFAAAMLLLADRRRAPVAVLAGGLVGALAMISDQIGQTALSMPSPTRTTHAVWDGRMKQLGDLVGIDGFQAGYGLPFVIAAVAIGLAVARSKGVKPSLQLAVVGGGLLLVTLAQSDYTTDRFRATQAIDNDAYLQQRDWVDEATKEEPVTALHGRIIDATTGIWWEALTFNESIKTVTTRTDDESYLQTFLGRFEVADDGRLTGLEEHRYVLTSATDRRFGLRGARQLQEYGALKLFEVPRPYRADWQLEVTDTEGHLRPGERGTLTFYGNGRERRGTAVLKAVLAPYAVEGYVLRASAGGRSVAKPNAFAKPIELRLPLTIPARGPARIALATSGTRGEGTPDDSVQITDVGFEERRPAP